MTTWVTFETIDETPRFTEFFVDRLGMHSYVEDDRTRFSFVRVGIDGDAITWQIFDREHEDDQSRTVKGSMRDCVGFMASRVLYGA